MIRLDDFYQSQGILNLYFSLLSPSPLYMYLCLPTIAQSISIIPVSPYASWYESIAMFIGSGGEKQIFVQLLLPGALHRVHLFSSFYHFP